MFGTGIFHVDWEDNVEPFLVEHLLVPFQEVHSPAASQLRVPLFHCIYL